MNRKVSKRPSRQKISAAQMDWVKKICLVLSGLTVLWLIFAPRTGVVSLFQQKSELKALKAETEELRLQNEALRSLCASGKS